MAVVGPFMIKTFCIHRVNRVNSRNGSAMMTAL